MLDEDRFEVLDIAVRPDSRLVGRPLAELPPTSSVIGAIVRDGALVFPRGEQQLKAGDRVIVLAERRRVAPAAVALADGESVLPFLITGFAVGLVGLGLDRLTPDRSGLALGPREVFLVVALVWTVVPAFGALPFLLGGVKQPSNPVDAYFESMSGFTATGATVLTHIEALGQAMQFWRQLTHWFGGHGGSSSSRSPCYLAYGWAAGGCCSVSPQRDRASGRHRPRAGPAPLEGFARPLDVAPALLLRLDERVAVHRVSLTRRKPSPAGSHVLPQPAVLPAQLSQLPPLGAGQAAILPGPRVPLGLPDPLPHRGLGQVEVLRDLAGRTVPTLAQLDDLGLELRSERAAAPGLLPYAP